MTNRQLMNLWLKNKITAQEMLSQWRVVPTNTKKTGGAVAC